MALTHSLACLLLPTPYGTLVSKRSPYFTLGMYKVRGVESPESVSYQKRKGCLSKPKTGEMASLSCSDRLKKNNNSINKILSLFPL